MVWGCMSAAGTGELQFIEGPMNANMHCDLLKQSMIPSLRKLGHRAIIIIILCYILYSAFLGTQSALHRRGESPQPPPMCSIHLDDATAAILRQNAHHTPAYWWRGDRVMTPISAWGWLGGHDGQRPMVKFGQDAGVTPLLFFEGHPGIFNDHTEYLYIYNERKYLQKCEGCTPFCEILCVCVCIYIYVYVCVCV